MKKICFFLSALATLMMAGCQRETDFANPEKGLTKYASVNVNMTRDTACDEASTKSVISIDDANTFVEAYMFAFDPQNGHVLKYENDLAGDEMKGKPIAMKTTEKDFSWVLPIQTSMDVWVLANPPQALQETLDKMLSNPALTKSDLKSDEFVFRCESAEALKSYVENEEFLPMVGIVKGVSLADYDSPLSVKLERLFAHYVLRINTDMFSQAGWTITSSFVRARNSNTELPYFREVGDENCYKVMKLDKSQSSGFSQTESYNIAGYRQVSSSKLKTVDEATDEDILLLNERNELNSSEDAHFFFLENCQGKPETIPSSWSDVRYLNSSVISNCSYIEVGVSATKEGRTTKRFRYRIYLGQKDMKSDFDVKGNFTKRITLNIKPNSADGFVWTPDAELRVKAGGTIEIPFETSLIKKELGFNREPLEYAVKENETNNTMYKYSGYAIFSFDVDTEPGIIDIEGGSLTGEIRDVVPVTVHNYYSGFELGELGMSSALGIPVEQNNRGDSQFMKSVVLPTQTENSYLWSGASSVWEMQTRFQEKYEVKLEFDSSAEGAYTPNVKLWYFDHGSYPERFYYGADKLGTPASVLPARCTVKIHCKDDPDSSN